MFNRALSARDLSRVPLLKLLREPRQVAVAPASVGDYVKGIVGVLGDDGVVDDAAALVEEHGEGRRVWRKGLEGRGSQPFKERGRGRPAETVKGYKRGRDVKEQQENVL